MLKERGLAVAFLEFTAMHKYIAANEEVKLNVDRIETRFYRQQSGLRLWAILGVECGYINYIWTTRGWQDIDYFTELWEERSYEGYYWTHGEPKLHTDLVQEIVRFVIHDRD